jgi:hypothetical protein
MGNMTDSQSQSTNQSQQTQQQPPQQSTNQSKGPLEQLGESVNKMIGGGQ